MNGSSNYKNCTFTSQYNYRADSVHGTKKHERCYSFTADNLLKQAFQHIELAAGLSISFFNFHSDSGLKINYHIQHSPIIFNFILTGNSIVELSEANTNSSMVTFSPRSGSSSIRLKPESTLAGTFIIPPRVAYSTVSIQIEESFLKEYLADDINKLPQDFCDILYSNKSQKNDKRFFSGLTPPMLCAALSASNGAKTGGISKRFLQAKANELICLKLFQLMEQNNSTPLGRLSQQDKRNILSAREILIETMDKPPTIDALARQVGINTLKLKQGFKREFGTTVYDYFRQYRLEKAMDYLHKGGKGVAETAHAIGYSNISHFIDAFKKRYGITPGELKRKSSVADNV